MSLAPQVSIVDDDEQVRSSLEALVQSMPHDVRSYSSGQEFLEAFSPDRPGCIVLDLRMPSVSGLDVLRELEARRIEMPVIMISGHADISAAVSAMKSGAVDFLEKPFQGTALLEAVRRAIDRDLQRRAARSEQDQLLARYQSLTPDEKAVLALTAAGKPDKAIALKLDLSLRTIQLRRASLTRKLHVSTRAELIRLGQTLEQVTNGMITGSES